jgi:hypothetical protein
MIGSSLLAAALLLAGSGAAKLRAPSQAAVMLRQGWAAFPRGRAGRTAVRVAGSVELLIGVAACATGGRPAVALLAGCYFTFLAVVARVLARGERGSCGCFGATDSPLGLGHVVVDIAAGGIAIAALVRPPGVLGGWTDSGVLAALVGVGQAGLLACLAFLSITALPALAAARRRMLEVA